MTGQPIPSVPPMLDQRSSTDTLTDPSYNRPTSTNGVLNDVCAVTSETVGPTRAPQTIASIVSAILTKLHVSKRIQPSSGPAGSGSAGRAGAT
jgi:hypothetical protein